MKSEITPMQKMLNVWAVVVILWSFYRVAFKTDLPIWFDEFIAKPLIFLFPVYFYITNFEKKKFLRAVDLQTKSWRTGLMFGVAAGIIFFLTGFVIQLIRQQGLPDSLMLSSIGSSFYFACVALATSVSEEVLSRGFVLKRMYAESKQLFRSVLYSSLLFFVLHIPILFTNPAIQGIVLIQVMITDILLSFAVSFLYLQKKSLFIPILIHAFYNLSLYLFL